MRTFPDPDPMLRFLDAESTPQVLARMPPQWRGMVLRVHLISLAAGMDPLVAWHVALGAMSDVPWAEEVLEANDDARIERMLADAATRRRNGEAPPPVFVG